MLNVNKIDLRENPWTISGQNLASKWFRDLPMVNFDHIWPKHLFPILCFFGAIFANSYSWGQMWDGVRVSHVICQGDGGRGKHLLRWGSWFIFFSNIFVGLWKILNNQKSSFTKLSSILIQKKIFQTWNPIFIFLQMFIVQTRCERKVDCCWKQ